MRDLGRRVSTLALLAALTMPGCTTRNENYQPYIDFALESVRHAEQSRQKEFREPIPVAFPNRKKVIQHVGQAVRDNTNYLLVYGVVQNGYYLVNKEDFQKMSQSEYLVR